MLVECKYHKNAIKRDVVQVLYDRMRAVGAQKGMVFSTSRFQSGAVEYAKRHGIALILLANGSSSYITATGGSPSQLPPEVPPYVSWVVSLSEEGNVTYQLICDDVTVLLPKWLKDQDNA